MSKKADVARSHKAELRTRWRSFMDDGTLAGLRSEGRLVAHYVFLTGSWTTCQVKFAIRQAARALCVHPNTARRGVQQLLDAGILEILDKGTGTSRTTYIVSTRSRAVTPPVTSGDRPRSRAVTGAHTSGDHPGHGSCPERTRVVTGAHTGGDHTSVLVSVSSVRRDSDVSVPETAGAGLRPARRLRPGRPIFDSTGNGLPVDELTRAAHADSSPGKESDDDRIERTESTHEATA
jgi:hypothetical protein